MVLGNRGKRAFISGEQRPNFEGNKDNIGEQIFDFWGTGEQVPTPGDGLIVALHIITLSTFYHAGMKWAWKQENLTLLHAINMAQTSLCICAVSSALLFAF